MNTPANWSVLVLSPRLGTSSGPVGFHGLTLRKFNLMSTMVTVCIGAQEAVGAVDYILIYYTEVFLLKENLRIIYFQKR